jgi:hypothetical protein
VCLSPPLYKLFDQAYPLSCGIVFEEVERVFLLTQFNLQLFEAVVGYKGLRIKAQRILLNLSFKLIVIIILKRNLIFY